MPEQNEWVNDARYIGLWDDVKALAEYREDCQHDLNEVPYRPIYNDIRQGLTDAIAQLDARIAELTPERDAIIAAGVVVDPIHPYSECEDE